MLVSWLCILLLFWQVFTSSGTTIPPYMRKNKTKNFKLYLTNDKKNIIFLLCYLQQRETLSKHYLRLLFIFKDILVITFNLSECKCGCKRTLIILTFCSNSLRKARCEVQCDSATQTAVAWCPHGRDGSELLPSVLPCCRCQNSEAASEELPEAAPGAEAALPSLCLKQVFPKYAKQFSYLRLVDRVAALFIRFLGVKGTTKLGPTGFRTFIRSVQCCTSACSLWDASSLEPLFCYKADLFHHSTLLEHL